MLKSFQGSVAKCLMAVAVAGVVGCSGKSAMDVEMVEGVVTLDGSPVEGATVTFMAKDATGMSAVGRTDANGVYKLTAFGDGENEGPAEGGTLPGEYYVGIRKAVAPEEMSQQEAEEQGVEYKPTPPGTSPKLDYQVPQKYENPKESGLTATVTDGENKFDFPLTK